MKDFTQLFIVTALMWFFMVLNALAAEPTTFKVQIENISSPDGQTASNGSKWPFALSPGIWAVHGKDVKLFTTDKKDTGMGLEAQAEARDRSFATALDSFGARVWVCVRSGPEGVIVPVGVEGSSPTLRSPVGA